MLARRVDKNSLFEPQSNMDSATFSQTKYPTAKEQIWLNGSVPLDPTASMQNRCQPGRNSEPYQDDTRPA